MAASASSPRNSNTDAPGPNRARQTYRYLPRDQNQLAPICTPRSWPWLQEQYGPSWLLTFLPGFLGAGLNQGVKQLYFLLQRMVFRFDKLAGYKQLFNGPLPKFVEGAERDDQFAWRRIAGANPLSLQQEPYLDALRRKIPLDVARIEKRLSDKIGRSISLEEEAKNGHLFSVDYKDMQQALRPKTQPRYPLRRPAACRTRDSRWRTKYFPSPIAIFLELPGFYEQYALVPLAIQIDQTQPDPAEHNPVYYPDDAVSQGWGWSLAKLYFETADTIFHAGCGHVLRTHMQMNPFCMATPRQLPEDHPVFVLLRPHTRFTMAANKAAYGDYLNRHQIYAEFYSCKLEEYRAFSIESYESRSFLDLTVVADMEIRHVAESPKVYPYRDDAKLWLEPLNRFVTSYVEHYYVDDAAVAGDEPLQNWKAELSDPECGAISGLVPGDQLDTRKKLIDLLAHTLFVAGPGHASQHFAEMHFYRYPLAFVGSSYAPPVWDEKDANKSRFYQVLPPMGEAATQFRYSSFGNYQYDSFGDYARYPLGADSQPQAIREAIRQLQNDLKTVGDEIDEREASRPLDYPFLHPARVPNSINI